MEGRSISISTPDKANAVIGAVDNALRRVSRQRADLGAYQNRFEMAAKGVAVAAENMQAAESQIRDTDMASQMVDYVKNQILMQSSTAMLAQANLKTEVGAAASGIEGLHQAEPFPTKEASGRRLFRDEVGWDRGVAPSRPSSAVLCAMCGIPHGSAQYESTRSASTPYSARRQRKCLRCTLAAFQARRGTRALRTSQGSVTFCTGRYNDEHGDTRDSEIESRPGCPR